VHEIKETVKESAFDNLILEKRAKNSIKSVVGNHEKKKSSGDRKDGGTKIQYMHNTS